MSRKGTKPGLSPLAPLPAGPGNPARAGNAGAFADREREALDVLGNPPEVPAKGVQDTVKLSTQTWQPPPRKANGKLTPATWSQEAQATVKVKANSWQEPTGEAEDAVTDVRDAPEPPTDPAVRPAPEPESMAVTGEKHPEVAGEIGFVEEAPVRIVSVPPSELQPAKVRLPGMPPTPTRAPMAAEASVQVAAGLAVEPSATPAPTSTPTPSPMSAPMSAPMMPTPTPPPMSAPMSAPMPTPTPTPVPRQAAAAPAIARPPSARPPSAAALEAPSGFAADPTPLPPLQRDPTPRPVDPTMLLRIERKPTRAIIVTAVLAAGLGLGAGYVLWGLGDASPAASPDSAAKAPPPIEAKEKPAVVPVASPPATCKLSVTTTPKAEVKLGELDLGVAPILEHTIPCDPGELVISRRRFEDSRQSITPSPDKTTTLEVSLERPIHTVTIKSKPDGAEVIKDGETVGKTPVKIELAGYTRTPITLRRSGYRDYQVKLTTRRKTSTVVYKLKRKR